MTNPIETSIAQHTPGPWRSGLYEISESCLKIQIEPVDSSKLAVAYAWGVDHEATKANAHLIAAAPEMLEALKVALQADPNQANHGYYKRIIAKAEGRANA